MDSIVIATKIVLRAIAWYAGLNPDAYRGLRAELELETSLDYDSNDFRGLAESAREVVHRYNTGNTVLKSELQKAKTVGGVVQLVLERSFVDHAIDVASAIAHAIAREELSAAPATLLVSNGRQDR